MAPSHWDTMSDKDSASLQAQSVAASQVLRIKEGHETYEPLNYFRSNFHIVIQFYVKNDAQKEKKKLAKKIPWSGSNPRTI